MSVKRTVPGLALKPYNPIPAPLLDPPLMLIACAHRPRDWGVQRDRWWLCEECCARYDLGLLSSRKIAEDIAADLSDRKAAF